MSEKEMRESDAARKALEVARAVGLTSGRMSAMTAGYFLLTPVGAAADGASYLLLLLVFSGGLGAASRARAWLEAAGLGAEPRDLLLWAAGLFLFRALLSAGINSLEGWLSAQIRRRVQEGCFARLLEGRWELMRRSSVGGWTGAVTEESSLFAKYLMSMVRALFSLLTLLVLGAMTWYVSARMALALTAIAVPSWLCLKGLYRLQTRLSMGLARSRQDFASDVNERLIGLFQIKAAEEERAHLRAGLRRQDEYTRLEVVLGHLNGLIMAFNPALLALLLGAYAAWTRSTGEAVFSSLQTLGGVGVLGFRALAQVNNLIAQVGNLTRLSGSVHPVHALISLPPEPRKEPVPEPLASIRLEKVSYAYGERVVLAGRDLTARPGRTLLLSGSSGAGKTTLANLICGLYEPAEGRVLYEGASGKAYPSTTHRPKIGYVTQDVHLFSGTVRENLDPGARLGEEELWTAVRLAGAEPFVKGLGGLDGVIAEAGRSLSGGEKRRLAIAAALAQRSDCLILDEVTNGLDLKTKTGLLETIGALSKRVLVVAISHDLEAFDRIETDMVALEARP